MSVQGKLNDVNNSVRTGMFSLQDGTFVPRLNNDNRSQVRAVVIFVNEDKRYAIGLCPTRVMLPFSFSHLNFSTKGILSGREATKILLEEAEKQNVELPAAKFCVNYEAAGVHKGEAFLPSVTELCQIQDRTLLDAWRELGRLDCSRTLMSSITNGQSSVWVRSLTVMAVSGWQGQYRTIGVMPAIEIPF